MLLFKNSPILKILLIFIGGILTAYLFTNYPIFLGLIGIVLSLLGLIIYIDYYKKKNKSRLSSFIAITFFMIGGALLYLQNISYKPIDFNNNAKYIIGRIIDWPKNKNGKSSFVLESIYEKLGDGKIVLSNHQQIIVFTKKDSFLVGQELILTQVPNRIQKPKSEYLVDYQAILFRRNIHFQYFENKRNHILIGDSIKSSSILIRLKFYCNQLIEQYITNKDDQLFLEAIVLGQGYGLNPELVNQYANSGVIHVLSVSGLHILLASLLFSLCFKFLLRRKTPSKIVYLILILSFSWGYTILSGNSSAAIRSAIMFTILQVGIVLDRENNGLNALSLSALIQLFINPFYLFDIGFQLSYSAVFGIIYGNFALKKWMLKLEINNPFVKKTIQAIGVCFFAQLITLPFIIYYFGSFPLYFLPANLLIIALSEGLLYVAFLFLLVGGLPFDFIHFSFDFVLHYLIVACNSVVKSINELPFAVVHFYGIELLDALLIGAVVILLICGWVERQRIIQLAGTGLFVLYFGYYQLLPFWSNHAQLNIQLSTKVNEFVIYPNRFGLASAFNNRLTSNDLAIIKKVCQNNRVPLKEMYILKKKSQD
jgi:competence protein ComEC